MFVSNIARRNLVSETQTISLFMGPIAVREVMAISDTIVGWKKKAPYLLFIFSSKECSTNI